jgi:copper resistance protein B
MNRIALLTAFSLGMAGPAFAQHAGPVTPPTTPEQTPTPGGRAPDAKPMQMPADHGDHDPGEAVAPPDVGNDIPPDPPSDFAADAFYPKADMDRARGVLRDEHGGALNSKIMANLLEYQSRNGQDGYRWEGEGWFGGDINRLVVKSEGEGSRNSVEAGEVQALYSRAVGPYTDLQIGVRHDFEPNPSRTYLAVGFETLLPYWFQTQGSLFVGERGQALGRLEGSYDLMLTQRLVLQPRAELNFATQNDAATGTGSGLSDAELGLRLRYEIRRDFAPYVGVSWERKVGDTADFARAAGERSESTSFVVGLRAWY